MFRKYFITTFIIVITMVFFLDELLFARQEEQVNGDIYKELISIAKEQKWEMIIGDASPDGKGNIYKVYSFATDKSTIVYKDSDLRFQDFILSLSMPLSNDGKKVAFWLIEKNKSKSLYVVDSDGSNLNKIIVAEKGVSIAWAPDNRNILFVGILKSVNNLKNTYSLYAVDIITKEVKELIKDNVSGISNQPWSPNGNRILYGDKGTILIYDLLTKKSWELAELANADWVAWAPRGDWIAYIKERTLNIINPVNFEKHTLIKNNDISVPIYWFPNGEYILYGVMSAPHAEIGTPYIIRVSDKRTEVVPEFSWIFASWAKGE